MHTAVEGSNTVASCPAIDQSRDTIAFIHCVRTHAHMHALTRASLICFYDKHGPCNATVFT